MSHITAATAPVFELPHLRFTGLAAPSRGATTNCVWRVVVDPGVPGLLHAMDKEEIFVALGGLGTVTLEGKVHELRAGDAFIVPPGKQFSLGNPGPDRFEAVVVLPVGGKAQIPGQEAFSPPWSL